MVRVARRPMMAVLGILLGVVLLSAGSCDEQRHDDRYEYTPSAPPPTSGWTHYTEMPSNSTSG